MTQMKEDTEKSVQYLFGELVEAKRDALEDRIFADEDFALFLNAVEKDLVDDYVRGEMDAGLRERFEQKYLISAARREKVRTAGVLQKELFAEKETSAPVVTVSQPSIWESLKEFFRVPIPALAGGLATILLLVLLGWILFRQSPTVPEIVKDENENRQIQPPTPQISPEILPPVESNKNSNVAENTNKSGVNTERKKSETKPAPTKIPIEKPEKREILPQPRIFVATLLPTTRSGETPFLTIPKNTENVQLRVVHDNLQPFIKYRAEIRDSNGEEIFVREISFNRKNPARPITLSLKTALLKNGSYELVLSGVNEENGVEPIKFYNFTVSKK